MVARDAEKRAFYASPGAGDAYLRPRTGQGYAPRLIATGVEDEFLWTAWVHRKNGRDYLVASRKRPGRDSVLRTVEEKASFFCPPALLCLPGRPPELFCALGQGRDWEIRAWRFSSGRWLEHRAIPLSRGPVYRLVAAAAEDGSACLAWSSLSRSGQGLSVYTRFLPGRARGAEIIHPAGAASVNRPALVPGPGGVFFLAADAYESGSFRVIFKPLKSAGAVPGWETVTSGDGWHLFPSLVTDAAGRPWVACLRQELSGRDDLAGLRQEALVSMRENGAWTVVGDGNRPHAAHLNLGLLPLKRYFGYAGLRRRPRLMPLSDGSLALAWEQQRDEKENWENVENGFFCARRHARGRWQEPVILHDGGCCHEFDRLHRSDPDRVMLAVKGAHRPGGNDFRAVVTGFGRARPYPVRPERLWAGWRPLSGPVPAARRKPASLPGAAGEKDWNLYWADLHCHGFFSPDAEGEPDELFYFARDLAGLDVVCLADNDFYPHKTLLDSEVDFLGQLAPRLSRRGDFLALGGYEWTYHRPDPGRSFNHRIVVFFGDERRPARRNEPAGRSESAFRRYLAETGNFNFPHHAFWRLLGAPGEDCVEVASAWGLYIRDADTVSRALNSGAFFGFLGNSDSHRFMPGLSGALTGIYAENRSAGSIRKALCARRCFATTGSRTALSFRVGGAFMGRETACRGAPLVEWAVEPEEGLEYARVIRDGEVVMETAQRRGRWLDREAGPGRHWYCLEAREPGEHRRHPHNVAPARGRYAWSSPVRVKISR